MILNACDIKILLQKQYWENLKIIVVENTWKWGTAREKEQTKKYKFFPDGFQNVKGLPLWNRRFKQGGCSQEDRLYPRHADLPRFRVANQAIALRDFPLGRGCRSAARRPLALVAPLTGGIGEGGVPGREQSFAFVHVTSLTPVIWDVMKLPNYAFRGAWRYRRCYTAASFRRACGGRAWGAVRAQSGEAPASLSVRFGGGVSDSRRAEQPACVAPGTGGKRRSARSAGGGR